MSMDYYLLCVDTWEAIKLGKFSCLDQKEWFTSGNYVSWNITGWGLDKNRVEGKALLEYIGKFCVLCRNKELRVVPMLFMERIDPDFEAIRILEVDEIMNRVVEPDLEPDEDFDRMPHEEVDRLKRACAAEAARRE